MNRTSNSVAYLVVAIVVAGVSFYAGVLYSEGGQTASDSAGMFRSGGETAADIGVDLEPFFESWKIIEDRYVFDDAPSDTEKLWGAISGLVDSIGDPHSVFLPPRESEIFEEDISGTFSGVGMEISIQNDVLTVIAPLEGSPAKAAGIVAGDRIVAIDSALTSDMSIDEAVGHIRGERGTVVVLTIIRDVKRDGGREERKTLEISVARDNITIPTIQTRVEDSVFVIEFFNFSAQSPQLFRGALREFQFAGTDKMIVDLRGNPGGFLDAAIDTTSWFLPLGKPVVRESLGGLGEGTVYRSKGYNIFTDRLKLVVLVDRGSASASEIFAGALSEYGIATLVGTRTFGKGSVQELIPVTNDTFIKLTVAKWLTPNGNSISDNGLTPDVEVEITQEDLDGGRDPQLEKALEIVQTL